MTSLGRNARLLQAELIRRCAGNTASCVTTRTPARRPPRRGASAPRGLPRRGRSPRVGSSSTSRSARTVTEASPSRSRSPLERSRGCRPAAPARPKTLERSAPPAPVAAGAEGHSSSNALADEVPAGVLRRYPARPAPLTIPRSGSSRPAASFARVVFPDPFGPFEDDDLARQTANETPRKAGSGVRVPSVNDMATGSDGRAGKVCILRIPARTPGAATRATRPPLHPARRAAADHPRRRAPARRLREPARLAARREHRGNASSERRPTATLRAVEVELRRRLVQEQEPRPERERRRRQTRCSSPPESSCVRLPRDGVLRRAEPRSTRAPISAGGDPRFSGPNATSFATSPITTWSSGSWNRDATAPASTAGRTFRVSTPPTSTRPSNRPPWKCGTRPARARRSVDLPPAGRSQHGHDLTRLDAQARRPPAPASAAPG